MAERKTTKKSSRTTKKSSSRKTRSSKSTHKRTVKKSARRKTTSSANRGVSLRRDLTKYAGEEHATSELLRGAMLLVEREGADVIRAAAMAILAGKVPLAGEKLAEEAVDSIVRQFSDDYKKLNGDDRKAVRGALSWLTGDYPVDTRTSNELVAALSGAAPAPAESAPPPLAANPQLDTLAQGFVLPPKPPGAGV
jgi:hypothetical protein